MFLKGPGFDRRGWLDDLRSTFIENPPEDGVHLSPLWHQIVGSEGNFDHGDFWLHPLGGIRGVTVRQEDGEIALSLPVGSSSADFDLAWDLMRMGVNHGAAASDEESGSLNLSDEQIRRIADRQSAFQWSALVETMAKGEATLPIGGFLQMKLDPRDAEGGPRALEEILTARMDRYADAYVTRLMVVRSPLDGTVKNLSNYGHMASLVDAGAELITTLGEWGNICETPVPAGHFYEVLGDRVENLGEYNYVPAIDFRAEPELTAALRRMSVPTAVPRASAGRTEALTDEDWATLAKAPCIVFVLVASANGRIDKKELALFRSILKNNEGIPSPIFATIINVTKANVQQLIAEISRSEMSLAQQLLQISFLLQSGRIPRDEAVSIARCLCKLGKAVATASGGFLGFGSKISKKEAEMLDFLETILLAPALG